MVILNLQKKKKKKKKKLETFQINLQNSYVRYVFSPKYCDSMAVQLH